MSISWKTVKEFEDITFKKSKGIARIAFNRPEIRNAFRPKTLFELQEAFLNVREDADIGVVLLTGEGPSPKDGKWAFCSGGDQNVRGKAGYKDEQGTPRHLCRKAAASPCCRANQPNQTLMCSLRCSQILPCLITGITQPNGWYWYPARWK